jgi:hypothetical protein
VGRHANREGLKLTLEEEYQSIRPLKYQKIYDIAMQAGLNGAPWEFSRKTGKPIDPSDNIYQNSLWTFGGKDEPFLACIWWTEIKPVDGKLVRVGNSRMDAEKWANMKTDIKIAGLKENRLAMKIKKAQAFGSLISTAYLHRKPVRVSVLDGNRPELEEAAHESATADKRLLDEALWWVHKYDVNGAFELVRGIEPPPKVVRDPFNEAPEPGTDNEFLDWLENSPLSDTEKDAIVKIRVGQGYFRDALIERWKGCAVTQCKDPALLIASHIKPWSKCTTRAERLSPDNGLLLTPNLDKAFDRGFISFDDNMKMIIHPNLHLQARNTLPINPNLMLTNRSHAGMTPYLKWHRQYFGFDAPTESGE